MKIYNFAPAAQKALDAWNAARAAAAPSPSYNVCTDSGMVAACPTFTGAYNAIRFLPARERETALIYDENGYCVYR